MWILHPPLIDGLWIIWSHFLYVLYIPNWRCHGFVWTQVPFSGTSVPVVSCLPCSLLSTPHGGTAWSSSKTPQCWIIRWIANIIYAKAII